MNETNIRWYGASLEDPEGCADRIRFEIRKFLVVDLRDEKTLSRIQLLATKKMGDFFIVTYRMRNCRVDVIMRNEREGYAIGVGRCFSGNFPGHEVSQEVDLFFSLQGWGKPNIYPRTNQGEPS